MKLKLFSLLALCMSLFTTCMPNHRIPTVTIFLYKGTTTDYKIAQIDSFAFVRCNFALEGGSNPPVPK